MRKKPKSQRSLTPDEIARVMPVLRAQVERYGSQTALAKALDYSQQSINKAMSGESLGYGLARRLLEHVGYGDAFLRGESTTTLAQVEGWDERELEFRAENALMPNPLPDWAFDLARRQPVVNPPARATRAMVEAAVQLAIHMPRPDEHPFVAVARTKMAEAPPRKQLPAKAEERPQSADTKRQKAAR